MLRGLVGSEMCIRVSIDLRIEESQANIRRIEAVFAEQMSGPRAETIDAAKAKLNAALIERDYRANELNRLAGLRARNLTSVETVDSAENFLKTAGARMAVSVTHWTLLTTYTHDPLLDALS